MIAPVSFKGVYKIENASQGNVGAAVNRINDTIGSMQGLGYDKLDKEITSDTPCALGISSGSSTGYILTGDEAKAAQKYRQIYENSMNYFNSNYGGGELFDVQRAMGAEIFYEQMCDIVHCAYTKDEVEVLEMDFDNLSLYSDELSDERPKFRIVG